MTHASLFSGIGGPEIAAEMLGWDNLFHCEINEFGRRVLDYWFPNSKSYEDITKTDFSEWRGKVNVLTGGFPCQPFSYAGKRRGADDDRYLWPYMFKAIDAIRPAWIVAENVAGITTMVEQGEVSEMGGQASMFEEVDDIHRYRLEETFTLQRICDDLEGHGYSVQPVLVPACAVGAPHRRDRVFIVARRSPSDTANDILQHWAESKSEGCETGTIQGQRNRAERNLSTSTNGNRGSASDTDGTRQSAPDQSSGRTRKTMDGECRGESFDGTERPCTLRPIADTESEQGGRCEHGQPRFSKSKQVEPGGRGCEDRAEWSDADTNCSLFQPGNIERPSSGKQGHGIKSLDSKAVLGRWDSFPSVSPVHRGDDGIPFDVDRLAIPFSKWRKESLKAYGNAIVPQVMYEIFRFIEIVEKGGNV